jgi:hypothetical protein
MVILMGVETRRVGAGYNRLVRRAYPLVLVLLGCNAILGYEEPTLRGESAPDDSVSNGGQLAPSPVVTPRVRHVFGAPSRSLADPAEIFGAELVLWLDADDAKSLVVENGALTKWLDRSSFRNDGNVVYSTPADSPLVVKQDAVNGHAAVKFSPVVQADSPHSGIVRVDDSPSLRWGSGDFLITMVFAYANAPGKSEWGGYSWLWKKTAGPWPNWGPALSANAGVWQADGGFAGMEAVVFGGIKSWADSLTAGAWSTKTGLDDGAFHVVSVRKDGARMAMSARTDGDEASSSAPIDALHDLSNSGVDVEIGGYTSQGYCCFAPLDGHIAEVIAVRGQPTLPETQALARYIGTKYGLVW